MRRQRILCPLLVTGAAASVLALVLAGCNRSAPTSAPAQLQVALATPLDAARSLLLGLQMQLNTTWRGDRKTAETYRDQIIAQIADPKLAPARLSADERQKLLQDRVDRWASTVAYYVNGLDLAHMTQTPQANEQVVFIPATGATDHAIISVVLVQAKDGWRVDSVGFAEPAATTQATTRPNQWRIVPPTTFGAEGPTTTTAPTTSPAR